MELRIKELLKEQGLRMSDLANRMDTDASNLTKSLSKNPTLSTLQDVAKALNVHIHELFTRNIPMRPSGVTFIGDRAYGMVEMASVVRIPFYCNYAELRKDIKNFVRESVEREKTDAFSAIVDGYEMISLVYDSGQKKFILTIYYGYSDSKTFLFDLFEFAKWMDGEGGKPVWNLDEVAWAIIGDVENEVPIELGDLTTPADLEDGE